MRNCFIFSHGSTSMDVAISRDRELRGGGTFQPHAWYVASLGRPWDREQLTAFQRRAERWKPPPSICVNAGYWQSFDQIWKDFQGSETTHP